MYMSMSFAKKKNCDMYFGLNNWKEHRGHTISYRSILDNDNIILRTENICYLDSNDSPTTQYILMVGNNRGVYLKGNQVQRITYFDNKNNAKRQYLVKLNRNYFKVYYFKYLKAATNFITEDNFDDLYEEARIQESLHEKIKL